jgi:hypothetical protein
MMKIPDSEIWRGMMADTQNDMFGTKRISIPDNPTLERVATMIFDLYENHYPEMFDGKEIKDINRTVRRIVWEENGLAAILMGEGDKLAEFEKWHSDSTKCIDPEIITRATRYLVEKDFVRISASAVKSGERQRVRLTGAFGRK